LGAWGVPVPRAGPLCPGAMRRPGVAVPGCAPVPGCSRSDGGTC
jgi:hypothetical protein